MEVDLELRLRTVGRASASTPTVPPVPSAPGLSLRTVVPSVLEYAWPSIVVPPSASAGRATVTPIDHQFPPPPLVFVATAGTKRSAFAPTIALAFWIPWRSAPWIVRFAEASSSVASPPRRFVTTLKLNAKLAATLAAVTFARATCS